MKRIFTLLLLFAFLLEAQSQNKFDVLFSESFSSNALPAGWVVHDLDGQSPNANVAGLEGTWVVREFSAGDFALLSSSWYNPPGASDDWVVSSQIDLSTVGADDYETITLAFTAVTLDATFRDGYEVYISTTGQNPEDFTDKVLTVGEENTEETLRSIDISNYAGSTFYIAIRNNSNDKFVLVVDNITVIGISGFNANVNDVSYRSYNEAGTVNVNFNATNLSASTIDNITVQTTVDGGTPMEDVLNVGAVNTLSSVDFSLPITLTEPGKKDVSVLVTSVNGNELDTPNQVDFEVSIIAEENQMPRRALIETFTSSTCPPCLPGNELLHQTLAVASNDDPVVIKFQQDFPGDGDGYATVESITRRQLYGISGIPNTNINGHDFDNNTNAITLNSITTADNRTAFFDLNAEYAVNVETQTVYVRGDYTPLSEVISGTRLMIAIMENETFNNESTNGETEFLDVFKKFIPGAEGIEVPAGAAVGTKVEFEYAYQFQGNYRNPVDASNMINHSTEHSVEEFEDLSVALWIESVADANVLNATTAVENGAVSTEDIANINEVTIFPNPVSETLNIQLNLEDKDMLSFRVLDMSGRVVQDYNAQELSNGAQSVNFNVSALGTGTYMVEIKNATGAVYTPFIKL